MLGEEFDESRIGPASLRRRRHSNPHPPIRQRLNAPPLGP
jgi:hypothetical protein